MIPGFLWLKTLGSLLDLRESNSGTEHTLREIFVEKPFRKQNVGSRLLMRCEDLVKEKGETSIYLFVEPRHSVSLRFLTHNGYDTLNTLELRKDFVKTSLNKRQGEVKILGHRLRLLKRKARQKC